MAGARNEPPRKVKDAIRQVLDQDWDPLEVGGDPIYDTCVAPVYELLLTNASAEEIAECFFELERTLAMPAHSKDQLIAMARKLQTIEVA